MLNIEEEKRIIPSGSVRRAPTFWMLTAKTCGHTPESFNIEAGDNMYEAGHSKIDMGYLYKPSENGYSLYVKGNGGKGLTPGELNTLPVSEGIDSKKDKGYHAGRGQLYAACSQIYDKEDGRFILGCKNPETGRKICMSWDGKSDTTDGVFDAEGTAYEFDSDSIAGVTTSKATEDDLFGFKKLVQIHYLPALKSGKLQSLTLNGEEITPQDIMFEGFRKAHPEYDESSYFEGEIEIIGQHRKKYIGRIELFTIFKARECPDFEDYIPDYYKDAEGNFSFEGGIGFADEDYCYMAPDKKTLTSIKEMCGGSALNSMDMWVVGLITLPSQYYKENATGNGNKILGITDILKKKSLYPIFQKVKDEIAGRLNQVHSRFCVIDKDNPVNTMEIDAPNLPNFYASKLSEFGHEITVEKKDGKRILAIPEEIVKDSGCQEDSINSILELSGKSVNAYNKYLTDTIFKIANTIGRRSKAKNAAMKEFISKLEAAISPE